MTTAPRRARIQLAGPLAQYAAGFREELAGLGYAPGTTKNYLRHLAHLSAWLVSQGLDAEGLTAEAASAFVRERRALGYRTWTSERGSLSRLLGFLRRLGVAPPPPPAPSPAGPIDELLARYRHYLHTERALCATTVEGCERTARVFLKACFPGDRLELDALSASEVVAFVLRESPRRSVGTAKLMVSELRCLLRYLHLEGLIETELAPVVPAVAGWRDRSLPRGLERSAVDGLLAGCDRTTAAGRRDFAILVLLVRLGLRAREVATLQLSDFDWRSGEVLVRGKGRSEGRLPLPEDVGQAVVAYLQGGRPESGSRRVFLQVKAPYGGLARESVKSVVVRACHRAGMAPVGPHRLRHTAATEMLRAGSSLAEVGQVLRHRSPKTTAIYAKVDRKALRSLAPAWPGVRP